MGDEITNNKVNIANTELSLTRVVVVVVFLLGIAWGFFNTVILPINNLTLGQGQVLVGIADLKASAATAQQEQLADEARITLLESEVKIINNKIGIK